jgi:hypothetical protein
MAGIMAPAGGEIEGSNVVARSYQLLNRKKLNKSKLFH